MSTAMTVSHQPLARFHGGVIRGKLRINYARFELEEDRLVVFQFSRWLMGMGLLGLWIMHHMQGKRAIDVDFAKVESFGRGKFGRNRKILDVTMTDGMRYRFQISDDWSQRVREQIATRVAVQEAGVEQWQVAA